MIAGRRVWPLNVGQVYTTLDRLVRDGLVVVDDVGGAPAQKTYAITAAGREELGAWWRAVPSDDPPPRDELMLKVLMSIEHAPGHAVDRLAAWAASALGRRIRPVRMSTVAAE